MLGKRQRKKYDGLLGELYDTNLSSSLGVLQVYAKVMVKLSGLCYNYNVSLDDLPNILIQAASFLSEHHPYNCYVNLLAKAAAANVNFAEIFKSTDANKEDIKCFLIDYFEEEVMGKLIIFPGHLYNPDIHNCPLEYVRLFEEVMEFLYGRNVFDFSVTDIN